MLHFLFAVIDRWIYLANGYLFSRVTDNAPLDEDRPCEGTERETRDRFRFTFSRDAGTIKSFVNELTLIANDFASACITVGMPRNFAFIRENAPTNNRIDVNERSEPDEKVSRAEIN